MAEPQQKGPTGEIGHPSTVPTSDLTGGVLPWNVYIEDRELAPDVTWPQSVDTFRMMQADAQIKGLLMATTLPIRRLRWEIDPDGAKPEVVSHIAESMNLPVRGEDEQHKRQRGRFNHDTHLAHALRAIAFGHFYFEQVGYIGDDGLWHLRKLATRPPRTISNFILDDKGALEGIEQFITGFGSSGGAGALGAPLGGIKLEVSRLLGYVWDSEDDADWVGRSMLRACFGNWAIKSRLLRVDATKHERNAMGIPWFETDPSMTDDRIEELAKIAEQMRTSETGGGAGPGKLRLAGVEGVASNPVDSIRYHDEQMAKDFLLLFFNLGTTKTGSRALGSEFIDWYVQSQDAIADWYTETTQAHQIEDEVEINWGPDEQPPRLVWTRIENERAAIKDLVAAVGAGLVAVTPELKSDLSGRWGLPAPPTVEEEVEEAAERAELEAEAAPEEPEEEAEGPEGEGEEAPPSGPPPPPGVESGPVKVTEHTRTKPGAKKKSSGRSRRAASEDGTHPPPLDLAGPRSSKRHRAEERNREAG